MAYQTIVVAVDLSSESRQVIARAATLCAAEGALHLVYVQEPMDSVYLGVVPYGPVFVGMEQVESRLKEELEEKLDALAEEHGIPGSNRHFLSGTPAREIHRFAEDHDADLVVIGTHGQHGVQLLLGSTANSVLHGCICDVLAVRIRHEAVQDSE
ncbi:MAG: universal stress protein [Xanthomonadales bacterium]|nr:universal stress protein [Xanthomonadales bacterium]